MIFLSHRLGLGGVVIAKSPSGFGSHLLGDLAGSSGLILKRKRLPSSLAICAWEILKFLRVSFAISCRFSSPSTLCASSNGGAAGGGLARLSRR